MDDIRKIDDNVFYKKIKPRLEALESLRHAKLHAYQWRKKVGGALAAVLLPAAGYIDYLLLHWQSGNDDSAAGISFVVAGALWWWVTQPKRQYIKAYKQDALPDIARLFGDLTYDPDGKMPMKMLNPFKIVPHHHNYSAEDYFCGDYRGINIHFSEIHLQERRSSGKRTRYVTVFKGLAVMMILPQPKFSGHTIILNNTIAATQWFREKSLGLERADLVDPAFEKEFDVYTNDQVEARYLIHPVMIERLKGMAATYGAREMRASYRTDSVLVLLASAKNYFEPAGIHIPATDPQSLLSMKKEIGQILDLAEELELYEGSAMA